MATTVDEREDKTMELTILGRCGAFPLPGEATSGYLLRSNGKNILIDCGSGVLSGLFRFLPIESVDLLILSHLHYDHMADLPIVRYAIGLTRKFRTAMPNLSAYLPGGPAELVPAADDTLDLHTIGPDTRIEFAGMDIRFLRGDHPVESYGIRVTAAGRTFAYTGDTRMCPAVADMVFGADLAVMDAGRLERQRAENVGHLTARECAETAKQTGVKRLILSHLMPMNDPAETLAEAKAFYDHVEIAQPLGIYPI